MVEYIEIIQPDLLPNVSEASVLLGCHLRTISVWHQEAFVQTSVPVAILPRDSWAMLGTFLNLFRESKDLDVSWFTLVRIHI